MKLCAWILLLLGLARPALAQQVAPPINEVVDISASGTPVGSTGELPQLIQRSIASILRSSLGDMADSLYFSDGEILHFKNVQSDDSNWTVPMYDLRFELRDTTLGIHAYALELRVDHKGRLLALNWPATGYSDKAVLASWPSVLEFATGFAKRRKFYTAHFQVQLKYYPAKGKMIWVFQYPVKDLSNTKMLRTVEIDWQGPAMVKEYMDNYY